MGGDPHVDCRFRLKPGSRCHRAAVRATAPVRHPQGKDRFDGRAEVITHSPNSSQRKMAPNDAVAKTFFPGTGRCSRRMCAEQDTLLYGKPAAATPPPPPRAPRALRPAVAPAAGRASRQSGKVCSSRVCPGTSTPPASRTVERPCPPGWYAGQAMSRTTRSTMSVGATRAARCGPASHAARVSLSIRDGRLVARLD